MKLERPLKETYDFDHVIRRLAGETTDGPVPLMELAVDAEIAVEATGIDFPIEQYHQLQNLALGTKDEVTPEQVRLGLQYMDLLADFSRAVGYDYITVATVVPIQMTRAISKENPQQGNKLRMWQQEHRGIITSREELDAHEWPGEEQLSLIPLDYTSGKLAQGQKLLVFQLGIFECLNKLMGLETLAIQSIDDPGLVNDLAERLTQITEYTVGQAAAHPATGAIFYADDMGYNTGPFLSPGIMREIVFPKMKRIADACHRHGKPFILHSCGNIELLMEDLIEMVGIDARHSFQDNAYPVEPFHEKYSSRIGIVGGMDVDLLSRGTVDEVRSRTRQILEACAPKGRYAMGSGNSVTNYCKVENFYAMVDETRKWNEEHE